MPIGVHSCLNRTPVWPLRYAVVFKACTAKSGSHTGTVREWWSKAIEVPPARTHTPIGTRVAALVEFFALIQSTPHRYPPLAQDLAKRVHKRLSGAQQEARLGGCESVTRFVERVPKIVRRCSMSTVGSLTSKHATL